MLERRLVGERRACSINATISTDTRRSAIHCVVENISDRGAKLRFSKAVDLPKRFKLHLPSSSRGRVDDRNVELRWTLGTVAGVLFEPW